MEGADDYLAKAAAIEALAAKTPFAEHRNELLKIAQEWRRLAAEAGATDKPDPQG